MYEECAVYFWFGGFELKIDFFEWLRTCAILNLALCFLIVMWMLKLSDKEFLILSRNL